MAAGLDADAWQERLDRLSAVLAPIADHAGAQAQWRCPYKDRRDRCTAAFGCRNQRRPAAGDPRFERGADGLRYLCAGDDRLDYRGAWETDPSAAGAHGADAHGAGLHHADAHGHGVHGGAAERASGTVACGAERLRPAAGDTLFDYADRADTRVPSSCARTGICHECVVRVESGPDALSPRTEAERFLQDPFRLACQTEVIDLDAQVAFAPLRRAPRILTDGGSGFGASGPGGSGVSAKPAVRERTADPDPPAAAVRDRFRGRELGLAIDLGTTTVVMKVIDLQAQATIVTASFANPQGFAGSDIMHRISYAAGNFTDELQRAIVNAVNTEIRTVARACGFRRTSITRMVVAGNPTMRDILFGIDVQGLGQRPYRSSVEADFRAGRRATTALETPARRLGLHLNPHAAVIGLPIIGSHVGADTVACLTAIGMADVDRPVMLVDVGTNTEVVVGHRDRMIAASCPAGPAFEGGQITFGMPAYDGAIESLAWQGDRFAFRTIGGGPPEGICGSGLIDLVAELRRHGLITPRGVFTADRRLREIEVADRITFSRADASALAQAKAANYCGQVIAMRHFGIEPAQIDRLYLAGGFATYVDARNAIDIGMLAPVPADRIEKVGNAAVEGARIALLSDAERTRADELAQRIEHVELEQEPDFFELFVDGCRFEPMRIAAAAR